MPFPFTFSLSVPGLSNPFSRPSTSPSTRSTQVDHDTTDSYSYRQGAGKLLSPPAQRKLPITRRRPSPVPSPSPSPAPLSRKRGWEPTFAEPSLSTTTLASTSGYLDTPAKYRDMASASASGSRNVSADEFHEVEMFADDTDLPPPDKRRRGLAGSIVSTALSAALIGTAVGLTVYRLWRDRGKESPRLEGEHQHHQQPPPPPYQQGEWTPPLQVTPATPRGTRRTRHPVSSSSGKRPTLSHRRTRTRTHNHAPLTSPAFFSPPPPQPEFDFAPEPAAEVEDQMDWIGDKLAHLIEEGKRALGREIVVMSDAKEDEVDDGSGAWEEEEEEEGGASASVSRSGSVRRNKRPRSLAPSTHTQHGHSPSVSPRIPGFGFGLSASASAPQMVTPHPGRSHSRGGSTEFGFTPSTSLREDERAWESPEMRESMERARMRVLAGRGGV